MKAVVAAFNQEKALVGAFSVITNIRMELFEALLLTGVFRVLQGGAAAAWDFIKMSPNNSCWCCAAAVLPTKIIPTKLS